MYCARNVTICDLSQNPAETDLEPCSCDVALWVAPVALKHPFRRNVAVCLGTGSYRGRSDTAPLVWLEVFSLLGQNQVEEGVPSPEAQDAVA